MAKSEIQSLAEQNAIQRIVRTVRRAEEGAAPFALVLGAGFSRGLVPTTQELVTESLPLWMKSLDEGTAFEDQKQLPRDRRMEIARTFWEQFVKQNAGLQSVLLLDPRTGLPEDCGAAYKAIFTPKYEGTMDSPAQVRRFQRTFMRLDQPRLNAAHFLLASLLGVQPSKSRKSTLFETRAAFSRLILTTNFDPFLQIALQAVNRLYFMSDTPEVGVSDEIFDDQTDAIHLVYLHGSIHRRSQAATEDEIRAIKEKTAQILAPVLERHGVIVLGYSGWDDAIVEALAACDEFDHCLYWCGLEPDPLAKNAFGPRVPDILHKLSAFYVQTAGAGNFVAKLCQKLVKGLPRLLENPIGQLREMLDTIDLRDLNDLAPAVSAVANMPQLPAPESTSQIFLRAQQLTRERLEYAEQVFLGRANLAPEAKGPTLTTPIPALRHHGAVTGPSAEDSKKQSRQLLSSAKVAEALGRYVESLNLCQEALGLPGVPPFEEIELRQVRGRVHFFLGHLDDALANWSRIIQQSDATAEQVAKALINRSVAWGRKGEADKELADCTKLIEELPEAPVEQVARALVNRGAAWGRKGDTDKQLADYTRVIEQLQGVRVEDIATALVDRGTAWGRKGDTDKQLADYTRVIEQLPEAPVEQVARALVNRGVAWDRKGDTDRELADYTRVIEQLPAAPVEQVARAFSGRGWVNYGRGDFVAFLADTEAALGKQASLHFAAFNLGLALLACGRDAEAMDAYRRAAEQFPQVIDAHGLPDLEEAKKKWLTDERAKPVIQLLQSLKK